MLPAAIGAEGSALSVDDGKALSADVAAMLGCCALTYAQPAKSNMPFKQMAVGRGEVKRIQSPFRIFCVSAFEQHQENRLQTQGNLMAGRTLQWQAFNS